MNNRLLIINGPGLSDLSNFNEFGHDDLTLEKVHKKCLETCESLGISLEFCQTDDEIELANYLTMACKEFDALILNPVSYSHSSSLDFEIYTSNIETITLQNKPVIEVHIVNIFQKGAKITSPIKVSEGSVGFVSGFGIHSYDLAIRAVNKKLRKN
jgi:3-dehydroquinate dehydratase II